MTETAEIIDTDVARARLEEVTAEAFATTREQRAAELAHVRARETVAMLVDGCSCHVAAAYLLDSVLDEQSRIAGIIVPEPIRHCWRVVCACGFVVDGVSLTEADVLAARHADRECEPVVERWRH